jgi:hypothetical protein
LRNMIDIDLFDTDERLLINSAAAKVKLTDFTRQSFMENLNFTLSITDDDMVRNMVEGLQAKVVRLTDGEWDSMKVKIPFAVPYDAESNIDDVPVDEDVI